MTRGRPEDFFDFDGVAYLNCAYQGPLPRVAVAAVEAALELKKAPQRITEDLYFSIPDAYRREVAGLVGCTAADVAVGDSATHGVMLVVNGLNWRDGDEVVLPRGEFPSNDFPWRSLAARGVRKIEVEIPAGSGGAAEVAAVIGSRTRVVSVSWVTYASGDRRDLAALGELCRRRGILFVVDGSQGVGGLRLDLAQTPCDLLTCAGYKWLLGPYGLGFAYVAPELGERLALGNVNWFSIAGARDFSRLSECQLAFEPGARRFDVNETASFFNLAAGIAAVKYLREVTVEAVESHVAALLERLVRGLPESFRCVGDRDSSTRSNILCLAARTAEETATAAARLAAAGVVVSRREGTIRISPHIYNTETEIDRLLDVLCG